MIQRVLARLGISSPHLVATEPRAPSVSRDVERKRIGRLGEDAAVRQLRREGYRIIDRNYAARGGEVDIIAEHDGMIVFVEVKTRSSRAWASPESAVTPEKRARVIRAASRYLAEFNTPSPARYDIVGVLTDDQARIVSINIQRHAFEPA